MNHNIYIPKNEPLWISPEEGKILKTEAIRLTLAVTVFTLCILACERAYWAWWLS